jgi:nucleotide-binding universal stress UspA family protein
MSPRRPVGQHADVIAAVDFSSISPAVVQSAVRLGRKLGGSCHVLHVVEALTGEEETGPLLPLLRRWAEEIRAEADHALDDLLASVRVHDAPGVTAAVTEGRAFDRIIRQARELGAGLVVIGGPPPERILGSTAQRIVRKSPLPVVVVRQPPEHGYHNLVVGVDFSADADQAWKASMPLSEPGARLTACHVLNTRGLPKSEAVTETVAMLQERLRVWADRRSRDRVVRVRVESGNPKAVLLDVAREEGADLLAVGSRGRGKLAHLLLGSVAETATRKAHCDVLVAGEERGDFRLP